MPWLDPETLISGWHPQSQIHQSRNITPHGTECPSNHIVIYPERNPKA